MKKTTIDKLIESGRSAAVVAGAGYGASKVIDSISKAGDKDPKSIRKSGWIALGLAAIVSAAIGIFNWCKKRNESKAYRNGRDVDGDLYERQRRADGELYTIQKQADMREIQVKAAVGVYRKPKFEDDAESGSDDGSEDDDDGAEEDRTTWLEKFKSNFTMPTLPPFIDRIMQGVPAGYEEAMLLHLCSMLGAMCFSKVRALYSDGIVHAANLQVVVEGNWGTGKAKFEQLFKALFSRIIERSIEKIDIMGDPENNDHFIVQTTGIGTSMAKYVDILAENQDCHMYIFNSEVRALFYDLKKGNGLNFDFLRKAFENGDVCRNNKAKNSKNGIFPIFLNYTFTGTPHDINTSFKKELEGGTLSRIAWTCIPEAGRYPGVLRLPEGKEMATLKAQIDNWTRTYCYYHDPDDGDEAVDETRIDLDYVCKELDAWNDRQYELSVAENNPARKDVRMRMAAIAFHCAIVLHMLYDNPAPSNWQKRKQVVDLTLFIADYCIERFLHKFGKDQNIQRKLNQEAELVDNEPKAAVEAAPRHEKKELITDIATLKALHDEKDEKGQCLNGWDKLAELSGMPRSTVRRLVLEYEASLKH